MDYSTYSETAYQYLAEETTNEMLLLKLVGNIGAIAQIRYTHLKHDVQPSKALSMALGWCIWAAAVLKTREGAVCRFEWPEFDSGELSEDLEKITFRLTELTAVCQTLLGDLQCLSGVVKESCVTHACEVVIDRCVKLAALHDLPLEKILTLNFSLLEKHSQLENASRDHLLSLV